MALKTNPTQFVNFLGTGASASGTYTLSVGGTGSAQMMKRDTVEGTVVISVSQLTGGGAVAFDVDEYVNGTWGHVGTTGSVTVAGTYVIDSSGGASSTGATTFSSSSNLRLLGKGTDTRTRVSYSGTVNTVGFTVDYIGYFGS